MSFIFQNKKLFLGGFDNVTTQNITGWVYSEKLKIKEIMLLLGSNIIAKTNLKIPREDVSIALKKEGNYGFRINIPELIPPSIKDLEPNIFFSNEKGGFIKLDNLNSKIKSNKALIAIFKDCLNGVFGNVDGVSEQGFILGWVGKKSSMFINNIWMHADGLNEVLKIRCDKFRDDLNSIDIKNNSGFEVEINSLNNEWFGRNIWFSFDKGGYLQVPQKDIINLKIKSKSTQKDYFNLTKSFEELDSSIKLIDIHNDLKSRIRELPSLYNKYVVLLDDLKKIEKNQNRNLLGTRELLSAKIKSFINKLKN